ncbi:MAG: ParA family protein [Planctomycetia bacterium]|nr:ParA family protein [Planctomycetia bacterium]
MRTTAILNQKGGVGKTTTAVNVAAALAADGHRTCLVDLDPQANASVHLGVSLAPEDLSIYDVMTGDVKLAEVRREVAENLWLVPSHLNLAAAEVELAAELGRELILRDQLHDDPLTPSFEYILVDCPPSLGILTLNALAAVSEVVIPLQPQFFALCGLVKLLETIEKVSRRINPTLRLGGVVFCMYESGTRLAQEVSDDVERFFATTDRKAILEDAGIFQTRIRRNIRLAEAPGFGQSIFRYAPNSNGAEDYANLAREFASGTLTTPR